MNRELAIAILEDMVGDCKGNCLTKDKEALEYAIMTLKKEKDVSIPKKSLLGRFKEIYESGTGYKVQASNLDANGHLKVKILDKDGNYKFWLHVVERENGQIEWY